METLIQLLPVWPSTLTAATIEQLAQVGVLLRRCFAQSSPEASDRVLQVSFGCQGAPLT